MRVENADMIEAAVIAQQPHAHELNPFTSCCMMCGRSENEIEKRHIACDALFNHKPIVPPW